MNQITLKAYGKINMSLDVKGVMDDGYHEVEMVMQGIKLHDEVKIKTLHKDAGGIKISLGVNKWYLPKDEKNIAYKAALLMGKINPDINGEIRIDIKKELPVGAGLAGGSGNGAAVLLGLNKLWDLGLTLKELMKIGEKLGADVPFSMMIQAKMNEALGFKDDEFTSVAALAKGTGTRLTPIKPFGCNMVLVKPKFSVSTKEVYREIDRFDPQIRPNNKELIKAMENKNYREMKKNMVNILELYTLHRYSIVDDIKREMIDLLGEESLVLMTGSGPTVYGLTQNHKAAKIVFERMKDRYPESFVSGTLSYI